MTKPKPKTATSTAPSYAVPTDSLVKMSIVARRFGYADSPHFRAFVAASKGITPVLQGTRWFAWRMEFERALVALTAPTPVPAAGKASQ